MGLFNLFKKESFLGLDIGTSVIKIVELASGRKGPVLKNYAYANFENNLIYAASDAAFTDTVKKVGGILDTMGTRATKVAMALPSFAVFATTLELPAMPPAELKKAIEYESKYYIPVPLTEVILGWHIINPLPAPSFIENTANTFGFLFGRKEKKEESQKEKIQVFVTAAPKELVKKYTELTKFLGLKLVALETESFPMIRTLVKDNKEPFLIIDLGAHATTVSVVDEGYLQLTHGIDIGGDNITEAIARGMGIDFQRAEEFKIRYGISGNEANSVLPEITKSVFGIIKKELAHFSKMYYNKRGRSIKKAILIGGSANLRGLLEYFQRELGLQAEIGNPWKSIIYPSILEKRLNELGPCFSVAVGLALRNIRQF